MAVFDARGKAPHDGLDIKAPEGTPVRAAASGKVLYSGDGIKGYGNMVIIKHEQGLVTVYAHAARNLVKEGDNVERGALVVEVGRTGSAREAHLHFEVRKQEEPVNPLSYLPTRSEDGRENR
jgi:murein DD-endopeptidase MepM/ murein hydrolase activator NlpD